MKALTLWQPWAAAIAHGTKRVENRGWRPPASIIGQRIAIHASARAITKQEYMQIREDALFRDLLIRIDVRSHIVCTALVDGYVTDRQEATIRLWNPEWYMSDAIGWVLSDVRTFDPVPCKGAQGLWDVPADVFRQLQEQGKV